MNKILLWFVLLIGSQYMYAQSIQNGVLISWPDASGDIKIPDEVTEIAENCFVEDSGGDWGDDWEYAGASTTRGLRLSNERITSVDLNNVTKVGRKAFSECYGIRSILAPKVQMIGEEAFASCHQLTQIDLPLVTEIGKKAFYDCIHLRSVSIGGSLQQMGANPFSQTHDLQEVQIGQGSAFLALDNVIYSRDKSCVIAVPGGIERVVLPQETVTINEAAVQNTSHLTYLRGDHVRTLESYALSGANKLQQLYLPRLESVGFLVFNGNSSLTLLDLHLSPDFKGFEGFGPADDQTLTLYVANQAVKDRLARDYSQAKIVIGEPSSDVKTYTVNYSVAPSEGGVIEAWTTGAVEVNSGDRLPEGSRVSFKIRPALLRYDLDYWMVNGVRQTPIGQPADEILVIDQLTSDLTVVAVTKPRPQGGVAFFHSGNTRMGRVTATIEGREIKSSDVVPAGKTVLFTAHPYKGFRVTEWNLLRDNGQYEPIDGQYEQTSWSTTPDKDVDLIVQFDRKRDHFLVEYRVLSTGRGTLTATLEDGTAVSDYEAVPRGSNITFIVSPGKDNQVEAWFINGEKKDTRDTVLVQRNLQADLVVEVVCSERGGDTPEPNQPLIQGDTLISWTPKGEAVIPVGVKHIASHAFEAAMEMTGLTITAEVETIGELPFNLCPELKTLTVDPDNKYLTSEDNVIYSKDKTLLIQYAPGKSDRAYTLPASVTQVRPGALTQTLYLEEIIIASGNPNYQAVQGMLIDKRDNALVHYPAAQSPTLPKEIELPSHIAHINKYAMAYNFQLQTVVLPPALTCIEPLAMAFMANLQQLKIDQATQLQSVGDSAFFMTTGLTQFIPSSTLQHIGRHAFVNTAITELLIPAGCTIDEGAFRQCRALQKVVSLSVTPPSIEEEAFQDIEFIETALLQVPTGAKTSYQDAPGWRRFTQVQEVQFEGITPISTDEVTLLLEDKQLKIIAHRRTHMRLMDASGHTLYEDSCDEGESRSITLPTPGAYLLITAGGKAYKLLL